MDYFERYYTPAFTYKALNRLIQGSAADMTKRAMIDLHSEGIIPHLQVHDELDISVQNKKEAENEYNRVLPLINYENRQCGFRATKTIFKEGRVIKSDVCRHPIPSLDDDTKKGLLDLASHYDLIAMKWGL